MSYSQILSVARDLLVSTLLIAAPAVITSLVIGLTVSVLQTLTSIQEQTLNFVPRIVAVGVVLMLATPWMLRVLTQFTINMFTMAAQGGA